jgi:hypothetical protein
VRRYLKIEKTIYNALSLRSEDFIRPLIGLENLKLFCITVGEFPKCETSFAAFQKYLLFSNPTNLDETMDGFPRDFWMS